MSDGGDGGDGGDDMEDLDARWADIVANWDDPAPVGHDEHEVSPPDRLPRGLPGGLPAPVGPESSWRGYEPATEDEHWQPPDPEPLPPSNDLAFWVPTVGLGGGVCLLLFAVIIRPDNAGWYAALALAAMVLGFVTLLRSGGGSSAEDNFGIKL